MILSKIKSLVAPHVKLNWSRFVEILLLSRTSGCKEWPKISIITPSFNQAQYLENSIQSVLNQGYSNFEHIIVDAESTDDTLTILTKYPHLKWISEKDSGQSEALNKGLRMATGDIIGIINTDDYYVPNAFNYLIKTFRKHPDVKVFIGDCRFVYEGNNRSFVVSNINISLEDLIRYWDINIPPTQPSIFFMRELIDEFGYFDTSLDRAMDYDLWMRFARVYTFYHIPHTLAVYRFHNASKSGMGEDWSSFYSEWYHVYRKYRKYSQILPDSPLISIIIYYIVNCNDIIKSEYSELESYLIYVSSQRFKDLEVIIITDSNIEEISLSQIYDITIRVIPISNLIEIPFIDIIKNFARGCYLHCPDLSSNYPDRWYCDNVSKLLDNSQINLATTSIVKSGKYKYLSDYTGVPGDTLVRCDKYTFSIIIPTFNRSLVLLKCLNAIAGQDFPTGDFEVIICDDGSSDDTEIVVKNFRAPFALHYLKKENGGPGAARNMGIRAARGKFLLILNDDAILAKNSLLLHKLTQELFENQKIAVLGKFSLSPLNASTPFGYLLESTDKLFAYPTMKGHRYYNFSYFYTCNISIKRQAVLDAGLFDEDFKGPAAEDIELGYRLQLQGYRIYFNPDILALHDHKISPRSFYRIQKVRAEWGVLLMYKHQKAKTWYNHYDFSKYRDWARDIPVLTVRAFKMIQQLENIEQKYIENPQPDKLAVISKDMIPAVEFIQFVSEIDGFGKSCFFQKYLQSKYGNFVARTIASIEKCRISVIIATYNRIGILLKCLESLSHQTIDSTFFEVLVCDDGSIDGTYETLSQLITPYSLRCFTQTNSGPAVARNRAIVEASAELILFLNDDSILDPDVLFIHLEEHYARTNEKIAVLGSFLLHNEFNELNRPIGYALDKSDLLFDYRSMKLNTKHSYLFFYTCNISIRKKLLIEVGMFDSLFDTAGAEDIEIGYRLSRRGLSVIYRQDCIAWHAHSLGVEGLAKMFMTRGKGGVLLFLRHPQLFHHYRFISLSSVRDIRERHARLEPLVLELGLEVNRFNSLQFSPPRCGIDLSEGAYAIHFRCLWQATESQVRTTIGRLISEIRDKSQLHLSEIIQMSLDEAAITVYPALVFIKWYYDTLGMTDSPYIEELIKIESQNKVRLFMAHTFRFCRKKFWGEDSLYSKNC